MTSFRHISHDAYRPLLRDALLVLCLTMVVQTVSAQQGDGPLPRIGSMADSGEIRYFRLFPDIAAPDSAFVQATPVELTITVQDGEDRHRIVLSACEAEVFGRILLSFEQLARSDDALEQLRRLLPEPDLQRCFVSFMQKRVMAFSDFPALGGKLQRVLLRDGSEVEGLPVALTKEVLAMWTGGHPFDVRQIDALLEIIPLSHVDSVRGSFFTNSAGHGWLSGLIGAGATLWAIAELQREPRLGPGGTGTTVIPLPAAAVLAAGIGYCSGLLGASIAGDLRETIAFDGKHGDMAMEELHRWTEDVDIPPEVRTLLLRSSGQDSIGTDPSDGVDFNTPAGDMISGQLETGSDPLPDVEIGVLFLLHAYDVMSRPFSVLPGIWAGKAIPLLGDEQGRTRLLLFPRAAYGVQHASAGIGVLFRTEETVELSVSCDYVWNREELGSYRYQGTGYGVHHRTAWLDRGDWKRSTFACLGIRFALAGARVLLEARVPLASAVGERSAYLVLGEETEVSLYPLREYLALGISMSWPISF